MQSARRLTRDLSLISSDNEPRVCYRSTCGQKQTTNQARGTLGPAGRVRGERSYLDNGYRIDERERERDSSRTKEEKEGRERGSSCGRGRPRDKGGQ